MNRVRVKSSQLDENIMEKKDILNIVVASIRNSNTKKWLLIQRKRGDYQKKWALVGGKMKYGETIKDAIMREISEETGLKTEWKGIKAVINEKLIEKKLNKQTKQFFIILCETETQFDDITATKEGKVDWFHYDEILEMKEDIIPSDFLMITKILTKKQKNQIIEVDMIQTDNLFYLKKWEVY